MIYKTFFGKHIDLSKVISISDAEFKDEAYGYYAQFEIECMLLEHPIVYKTQIAKYLSDIERDKCDKHWYYSPKWQVELITGERIEDDKCNNKQIKEVHELQVKIDELIEVWKKLTP